MDALRAELSDWAEMQEIPPSHEVLAQFYTDSLNGGTSSDLAEMSVESILHMLQRPLPKDQMLNLMGVWCSAVLLGVRATKRAYGEIEADRG